MSVDYPEGKGLAVLPAPITAGISHLAASGDFVEGNATLTALLIALSSLLYTTVGQAGGTAFVAVMALLAFPPEEIRPTSLTINIVAAAYATWRLHRSGAIDWRLLRDVLFASLPTAFVGGLLILDGPLYLIITGTLLLLAAVLMVLRASADWITARSIPKHWTALVGALCGFLSGLTGVGGGVFLAPLIIVLGWASPRQAAGLSAPFILANSIVGLAGV